jgi:hypothetical protein
MGMRTEPEQRMPLVALRVAAMARRILSPSNAEAKPTISAVATDLGVLIEVQGFQGLPIAHPNQLGAWRDDADCAPFALASVFVCFGASTFNLASDDVTH